MSWTGAPGGQLLLGDTFPESTTLAPWGAESGVAAVTIRAEADEAWRLSTKTVSATTPTIGADVRCGIAKRHILVASSFGE